MSEMQSSVSGIIGKLDMAEGKVSELEEIAKKSDMKQRKKNHKKSISGLWDAFMQLNINLNGVPDKVRRAEKYLERP